MAREAVALSEQTEFLNLHGQAMLDLAGILLLLERRDDAADAARTASELYERKGNVPAAGEAGRFLAGLSSP